MNDCKKCENGIKGIFFGDIGCKILQDWLTYDEYKQKKCLSNCPKKEEQK